MEVEVYIAFAVVRVMTLIPCPF